MTPEQIVSQLNKSTQATQGLIRDLGDTMPIQDKLRLSNQALLMAGLSNLIDLLARPEIVKVAPEDKRRSRKSTAALNRLANTGMPESATSNDKISRKATAILFSTKPCCGLSKSMSDTLEEGVRFIYLEKDPFKPVIRVSFSQSELEPVKNQYRKPLHQYGQRLGFSCRDFLVDNKIPLQKVEFKEDGNCWSGEYKQDLGV